MKKEKGLRIISLRIYNDEERQVILDIIRRMECKQASRAIIRCCKEYLNGKDPARTGRYIHIPITPGEETVVDYAIRTTGEKNEEKAILLAAAAAARNEDIQRKLIAENRKLAAECERLRHTLKEIKDAFTGITPLIDNNF